METLAGMGVGSGVGVYGHDSSHKAAPPVIQRKATPILVSWILKLQTGYVVIRSSIIAREWAYAGWSCIRQRSFGGATVPGPRQISPTICQFTIPTYSRDSPKLRVILVKNTV